MCKKKPDQKEGAGAENMFSNRVKNCYEVFFNIYRTDGRMRCKEERRNVKRLERMMEASKAMYWHKLCGHLKSF